VEGFAEVAEILAINRGDVIIVGLFCTLYTIVFGLFLVTLKRAVLYAEL